MAIDFLQFCGAFVAFAGGGGRDDAASAIADGGATGDIVVDGGTDCVLVSGDIAGDERVGMEPAAGGDYGSRVPLMGSGAKVMVRGFSPLRELPG